MSQVRPSSRRWLAALVVAPLLLTPLAVAAPAQAVSPDLVISQVYGGGGNSGATYTHDFIEIFNRGTGPASLDGKSVQYASASGTTWQATALSGSLAPGAYYLVREAQGAGGTTAVPGPDASGTIAMSATAGKVALSSVATPLTCGAICATNGAVIDFVGYGGANNYEGAGSAPSPSNTTSALRKEGGSVDTDNNSADFSVGSPTPRTSAESAPQVSATTPTSGATGVPVDSNLTVTFTEPVSLAAGSVTLTCAGTDRPVAVTGGPTTWTVDPASDLPGSQSCTATVAASGVTDADAADPPDAMSADHSWTFSTGQACGDPATLISAVQGSGAATPLPSGSTVTVEGVVTADRTGNGRLRGFFVEEEEADRDGLPESSEGVFVFRSAALLAGIDEGDAVRVTGTVTERFGKTQISASAVQGCSAGTLPAAVAVSFPLPSATFLERYEGMRVAFPQDLVISEYFNYDRFGETVVGLPLDGESRFFTPTAVVEPGDAARERAAAYALRRVTLDDGRGTQNPSPPYFPGTVDDPFTLDNRFRGGDTLRNVNGVLDFDFGLYRVHPTDGAEYNPVNPRPAGPPAVGGDVQVASFNVLNYFLTPDEIPTDGTSNDPDDDVCGGGADLECRGFDGDQPEELERQRAKIVSAIAELDADVVGLMEMENTPGVEPAADLVAGLNDVLGAGTYDYIDTGVIGTDAIRLGFLYQPASVRPIGDFAVLDTSVDPRFLDTKNRPALAQTFDQVGTGDRFTAAVNHLKSKGSDCNDVTFDGVPDTDKGDGQGNCNLTRTKAAQALADWLAGDPTESGDPDSLIIGDLNSYDHEEPIDALVSAGFTDLVKRYGGEFAYGYVFDGQAGYLDHALADESLQRQVTGAAEWHINADEPDILDYDTSFKGPAEDALYESNPFRSSDHDAVLVGLDLDPATPEACYAGGAQTVDSFRQGTRKNGSAVPLSRSDPANALGLSDPGDDPYWVTLGIGGEIVIEFARAVQNNNLAAPDLRIVDAVDGAGGRADRADVYASFDGLAFTKVGTVTRTGTVDLGPWISARFIKVVDTTPVAALPSSADGYDLDAVEVLSGCSG